MSIMNSPPKGLCFDYIDQQIKRLDPAHAPKDLIPLRLSAHPTRPRSSLLAPKHQNYAINTCFALEPLTSTKSTSHLSNAFNGRKLIQVKSSLQNRQAEEQKRKLFIKKCKQ